MGSLSTDVFVSHSSKDAEYANELVNILSHCIDFFGGVIVCTSVIGYGLEFGSPFEKALRKHIEACEVFISLLSMYSLESLFCAFEMGAAWGQKKPIKSILLPGLDVSQLPRPLSSNHCFIWSNPAGWIQLIDEVAKQTDSKIHVKAARVNELANMVAKFQRK